MISRYWKAIGALTGALVAQVFLWVDIPFSADLRESLEHLIMVFGPVVFVYFFPGNKES